jgi:prepilin-type N-terminal cleavage/methylation domain-containing protein
MRRRQRCNEIIVQSDLRSHNARAMQANSHNSRAFTLIELLVVIAIIIILAGLLFPAYQAVQNQARKTQAKNDLSQIVTAVNAYYTEYGKYPLVAGADTIYGAGGTLNDDLFYTLRAVNAGANGGDVLNPRKIVFISPPDVKDPANPRSGIGAPTGTGPGQYYDPWGTSYAIEIDGDYNNQILVNPYALNAGATPLQLGVIAWSFGKDGQSDSVPGPAADKKAGNADDDVISWQ